MCGFAGYLDVTAAGRDASVVRAMAATLHHRGPDAAGTWLDDRHGLAFGHQRLAVIDVSSAGAQPMVCADGRYVMVLNGEIYNHRELRRSLVDYPFRGHSDSEVLLACIERYGVPDALRRAAGMFALAVWDREQAILFLARDRIGEKPLYYGRLGAAWAFGSELRALRCHPRWDREVDPHALAQFLRAASVPAPATIYRDIYKLLPGHYVVIRGHDTELPQAHAYWDAGQVAADGVRNPQPLNCADAVQATEACLQRILAEQTVADVPTGAFLSGGIDSSAIAALAQSQRSDRLRTFSIGFHEAGFDEAPHAAEVAGHLGTAHESLYVSAADALEVVPRLARIYDEPFADSSQIPTALLARLTRAHVTVALSGDGADEVFGGYSRYGAGLRAWRAMQRLPAVLRGALGTFAGRTPEHRLDQLAAQGAALLPARMRYRQFGDKVRKLAALSTVADEAAYYGLLTSHWSDPAAVLQVQADFEPPQYCRTLDDFSTQMMLWDLQGYLPDDILTKVDRASMAVSLEVRCPYLDHRLIELAWRLPSASRIHGHTGKWVLRQILYRYVPQKLLDRAKTGFAVPVGVWLRGPLREWGEDLLAERGLAADGYFRPEVVRALWHEHIEGRQDQVRLLWPVLMFQAWRREYGSAA